MTVTEVPAVFVQAKQFCNGQAAHLADDIHIQPAVIGPGFGCSTETSAISAAIAHSAHQTIHCHGLAINRVFHPASDRTTQLLNDRKCIGHLSAAQRDAPEFRDSIGHLRIQTGGADGRRKAETRLHQVDGHFSSGKLSIQIQKLFFCAEGTQKVISTSEGQAAHSGVFVSVSAGKRFVEGAVAACCIDVKRLPCLPGLFCCRMGQFPCMARMGRDLNGIFLRGKPCPGSRFFDLPGQFPGTVGLSGGGIQDKQYLHDFLLHLLLFL